MDFELTEEQRAVRDLARGFADREIKPRAAALDAKGEHPAEIVRQLGELKMMGMTVPEGYGGAGLDNISYVVALIEISKACASTGTIMCVNNSLYCFPVMSYGTHEQKMKYLFPCASGNKIGCYGLTEEGAGSDQTALRTTAMRNGDQWVINGKKKFVTSGNVSSYALIAALTERDKDRPGMSIFVIDLETTPGFQVGRLAEKLGILATGTAELIFEDARVPADALLGSEGEGLTQMLPTLDGGRIGIASQAVGIGRAVLEEALEYARMRTQFGKPISSFQAIQWKLADMATEVDAAELLTLRAACLQDMGKPYEKAAAVAKMFASDVTMKASIEGIQVLGGRGYCKEYPMERHMRDAKICQIDQGTNEILRLVVADNLIKGR